MVEADKIVKIYDDIDKVFRGFSINLLNGRIYYARQLEEEAIS